MIGCDWAGGGRLTCGGGVGEGLTDAATISLRGGGGGGSSFSSDIMLEVLRSAGLDGAGVVAGGVGWAGGGLNGSPGPLESDMGRESDDMGRGAGGEGTRSPNKPRPGCC